MDSLSNYYIVINCVRLFVVAMAMVVIGDSCVRSITTIRTITRLPEALSFIVAMVIGDTCITTIRTIIRLPEAVSFIVAMVMVVMGGTHYCSLGSHKMKASVLTTYAVPATALSILLTLTGELRQNQRYQTRNLVAL